MRQLKGKVKENAKEKKERKKEFMENKEKAFTIGVFVLTQEFLIIFVDPKIFSPSLHWSCLPPGHCVSLRGHQTQASGRMRGLLWNIPTKYSYSNIFR